MALHSLNLINKSHCTITHYKPAITNQFTACWQDAAAYKQTSHNFVISHPGYQCQANDLTLLSYQLPTKKRVTGTFPLKTHLIEKRLASKMAWLFTM